MPRTPTAINYVVRLGDPVFTNSPGPPATVTVTIYYGVGSIASGVVSPQNYTPGDSRPKLVGTANGVAVSYTFDPTVTTYEQALSQLTSLAQAQEGLTTGDTVLLS